MKTYYFESLCSVTIEVNDSKLDADVIKYINEDPLHHINKNPDVTVQEIFKRTPDGIAWEKIQEVLWTKSK